jgi:acetyl-CoA carboxylase biotin carboxyl carrier protein
LRDESQALMSDVQPEPGGPASRVRRLAEFLTENDLLRVRIERDGELVEVGRPRIDDRSSFLLAEAAAQGIGFEAAPARHIDTIRADLVGIFRLGRPAPLEGEYLDGDRDLAYVEALGIRNPVRSLGAGRIVSVLCHDGDAVEYGQPLFDLDRT